MKKSICLIINTNKLLCNYNMEERLKCKKKKWKVKQKKMRKAIQGLVHEKRIRPHLVS